VDEFLGQLTAFAEGQGPADDPAAEDVKDNVKVKPYSPRWSPKLRYIPRPELVGSFRDQLGFQGFPPTPWVPTIIIFSFLLKQTIHGPNGAKPNSIEVKQSMVNGHR
jgi:hypothetical protein